MLGEKSKTIHVLQAYRTAGATLLVALCFVILGLGALESGEARMTQIYLNCSAISPNADELCDHATHTVEQMLASAPNLKDILKNNQGIQAQTQPSPLPSDAVLISVDIVEKPYGVALKVDIIPAKAPSQGFEQSLSVVDRNAPTSLSLYKQFIDKFLPLALQHAELHEGVQATD